MPRAALLSLHARVARVEATSWEDPALVQVWGPRYSAYAVAREDIGVFTLGRLPADARGQQRATELADRVDAFLDGRRLPATEIGRGLKIHPSAQRYAAPTGRILIRWDGARQPTVWTVPAPEMEPEMARLELARRHLSFFGPSTPSSFATWAGIKPPVGRAAFEGLAGELAAVRTPLGDAWMLAADEPSMHARSGPEAPARLLPSGDVYYLLQGTDRELLIPEADRRARLWTSRVWPGAVLVGGEIIGTWRRAEATVTVDAWRRLSNAEREAVESEAAGLPLPGLKSAIQVRWVGG